MSPTPGDPAEPRRTTGDPRITLLATAAIGIGAAAGGIAFVLYHAIGFLTNLAFYGRIGFGFVEPNGNTIGLFVVIVPAVGGILAGLLIRYGSPRIVGHGIPETMEAVVAHESRIPPRVGILKAVASTLTIGLGQPFGVEGPIIQTGGAFGSTIGQWITVTPSERRILVSTGAAAGMAAIFGTPISAVLLAVELLLFEFRVRSLIPIALGSAVGAGFHFLLISPQPLFPTPPFDSGSLAALPLFILLGLVSGIAAVGITSALYASERLFRRLPFSQPWLPALGGLLVGAIGFAVPDVLGVGYNVIDDVLIGKLVLGLVLVILVAKLAAWLLAMGSQTSGGTLAPLFLIGGSLGFLFGAGLAPHVPGAPVPEVFAVAAMAAVFGAAARAPLASSVFALEVTRDFGVVVPLFVTVFVAELLAEYLLPETIMTERLRERGYRIRHIYEYNPLRLVRLREIMSAPVVTVPSGTTVLEAHRRFERPDDPAFRCKRLVVVDGRRPVGVVDREHVYRELLTHGRPQTAVEAVADRSFLTLPSDATAYEAFSRLAVQRAPYLLVVEGDGALAGYVSRTNLLEATRRKAVEDFELQEGSIRRRLRTFRQRRPVRAAAGSEADAARASSGPRDDPDATSGGAENPPPSGPSSSAEAPRANGK